MSKKLDTVSKLLAKAEDVAGTPEAEAFMTKAQELATANGIDLAVARMHQANKERVQEPEERSMQCNPNTRRHNRKHFIELAMVIADVNDVEYLIGGKDRTLHMVGFPSDMDVIEALYTHLSIQMAMECDEALKAGQNKAIRKTLVTRPEEIPWEDREWGQWNGRQYNDDNPDEDVWVHQKPEESDEDYQKRVDEETTKVRAKYEQAIAAGEEIYYSMGRGGRGGYRKPVPPPKTYEMAVLDGEGNRQYEEKEVSEVDGRVFRSHFYSAFVMRMRGRLWEIKRSVQKDKSEALEESDSLAVALRDKKAEVDKAHEEQRAKVIHMGTYRASYEDEHRKYDETGRGQEAGRTSAERVPIDQDREVRH